MENRRLRGRPKRVADTSPTKNAENTTTTTTTAAATASNRRQSSIPTRSSPSRRASPARIQTQRNSSPVRRSSRPRSTTASSTTSTATVNVPQTISENQDNLDAVAKLIDSKKLSNKTTTTTTSAVRLSGPSNVVTNTVRSSIIEESVEYRSSGPGIGALANEILQQETAKLREFRRSLSKTLTDTVTRTHTPTTINSEVESRYSRSASRSVYDDDRFSKTGFSDKEYDDDLEEEDDDDVEAEDEKFKSFAVPQPLLCRKLEVPREFGGWFGALLLMLLVPSGIWYLQWSCGKKVCSFRTPNVKGIFDYKYILEVVFARDIVAAFLAYVFGVFLLSLTLFGFRVRLASIELRNVLEYKFNVLPSAVVVTAIAGAAQCYYGYPLAEFVLKHYEQFYVYGIVASFVVAFWMYARPNWIKPAKLGQYHQQVQWNTYGKSQNVIIDYAVGRQVNPKFFDLVEYKVIAYHASLLATLLIAESMLFKSLQLPMVPVGKEGLWNIVTYCVRNMQFEPSAVLAISLLLLYTLDSIVFEHHRASSFELQGEGCGCLLLLRYAVTPFLLSAVAKYFFERHVPITASNKYVVYAAIAVVILGLLLKRFSNALKYKYRVNPTNPRFANVDTIHTFQGKRLLLGSLWGRLRQPNYAGDILALIGLALPLALQFSWPPLVCLLLLIAVLIHRTQRVYAHNMSRYHSSWVRYSSAVRYYVLPKIF